MAGHSYQLGDAILTSLPFVHVLLHSERNRRCENCYTSVEDLLRCSVCKLVKYCGVKCQRKAWIFHKEECKGFQRVAPNVPKDSVLMLFRLLLRLKSGDDKRVLEEVFGVARQFKDLMSHVNDLKNDEQRCQEFVQLCTTLKLFVGDFALPSGEELLEIFGKIITNSFSVCDAEMQPIGAGMYLGASILDHSCRPNAVVVFRGTTLQVRCVRPIKATDKVTISYIDQLDTIAVRRHQLEKSYYFMCMCEACKDVNTRLNDMKGMKREEGHHLWCKDMRMHSVRCSTPNCTSSLFWKQDDTILPCAECGKSQLTDDYTNDIKSALTRCRDALEQAKLLKAEGRSSEMLDVCERCLIELKHIVHPFNIDFIKLLDRAFDACIDLGEWSKAIDYGTQLIEPFRYYLPEFHPNFAVHLMKLGKIQLYLDRIEEAKISLQLASSIVVVTHGRSHRLYETLCGLMNECNVDKPSTFQMLEAAVTD